MPAAKQQSAFETYLTGDKELDAKLTRLDKNTRKKYTRRALGKGGTVIVKAIKRNTPRGKTGNMRRAIGKSLKKSKADMGGNYFQGMRAGMNVGKKAARQAPHGHLNILGTKQRKTKTGKGTGKMTPNDFIRTAVVSALPQSKRTIAQSLAESIAAEANK